MGAAQNRAVPLAHPHEDPGLALVAVAKQRPQRDEDRSRHVMTGAGRTAGRPAQRRAPRSPSRKRSPSDTISPTDCSRQPRLLVAAVGLGLCGLLGSRREGPSTGSGGEARPAFAQHDGDGPHLTERSSREHRQRNHRPDGAAYRSPDQHRVPAASPTRFAPLRPPPQPRPQPPYRATMCPACC